MLTFLTGSVSWRIQFGWRVAIRTSLRRCCRQDLYRHHELFGQCNRVPINNGSCCVGLVPTSIRLACSKQNTARPTVMLRQDLWIPTEPSSGVSVCQHIASVRLLGRDLPACHREQTISEPLAEVGGTTRKPSNIREISKTNSTVQFGRFRLLPVQFVAGAVCCRCSLAGSVCCRCSLLPVQFVAGSVCCRFRLLPVPFVAGAVLPVQCCRQKIHVVESAPYRIVLTCIVLNLIPIPILSLIRLACTNPNITRVDRIWNCTSRGCRKSCAHTTNWLTDVSFC